MLRDFEIMSIQRQKTRYVYDNNHENWLVNFKKNINNHNIIKFKLK